MTQRPPAPSPEPATTRARADALWVAALYGLFASLWILLSDHLVALWIEDPKIVEVVSTLKGWGFVGVTSVLLYVLVLRQLLAGPGAADAAGGVGTDGPARRLWPRWVPYLLAVAATLAMLFLRMQVAVGFGDRPLLILMMFPILFSAMVGGLGPGLTATLCAVLGISYTAIPPVGSLRIAASHDLLQWGFLIVNGVLVSVLSEQMHRARQRVEANLRLQSVTLAGIADGVVAVDAQGRIGFLNPAAARLTGWDERQALGRPVAEVVRRLEPDQPEPSHGPLTLPEGSGPWDALILGQDGEIPVRIRSAPIAPGSDRARGRVLVLHDIREEQAVARMRERERALLRQLIETLPDLVWLKDLHGVYLACNRRFERFFGATETAILGRTDYDFVPRDLADFFRNRDRAAIAAGQPVVNEEELHFADDGHREWVETIKTPMHDADGRLVGVLGIARDITAARATTRALRESEERFRALVDASSEVVYRMSPDWSAMESLLGRDFIPDTRAPSVHWLEHYIPPQEQSRVMAAIAEAIRTKGVFELEHRVRRADGSLGWVWSRAVPLLGPDGEIREWFGAAKNITERRAAEDALLRSEQRMALAQEAAKAGTWEWELATNRNHWSDSLWALYGLAPHACEPSYDAWLATVHPEDRERVARAITAAAAAGEEFDQEWRGLSPAGGPARWLLARGRPLPGPDGRPERYLGIVLDISERKRTQAALEESEERLRLFIEHAPAALAMFDREMRYVAVSRRWLDDFGLNGRMVLGRPHYEVFPEIGEPLKALHRRGLAGEILSSDEDRFERQDGAVQWVRWEMLPWRAADGSVGGIVIFTEDITARKEAETAARRSETRYRALVDQAADPYFVHDHEGRFIEVNRQACESTGYSRDELLGMGVLDLEQNLDLASVQSVWSAMQPGTPLTLLGHHRRKDGQVFPVEIHATLLLVEDRRLYISLVRDLTERERAEQLIRTSERRFQDIARASADWIWEIDAENRYTYVSEGIRTMLDYAPEEVLGKTPFDLMPDAEAVRVGQAFAAIAARRESFRDLDNVNRRKDGRLVNVQTNGVPILGGDGRLLGYRGLARDVTEQRQIEQELRRYREHLEELVVSRTAELHQARAEAERLARAKGEFLANMSHEIRTPLNAVLGFARIGLRGSATDAGARAFAQILAAGEHLLGVINDVLDYSKIEAGKLGVERTPFQLAGVVANAGAFVSGIAAQKGIGYCAVLAPDLPDWVLGDTQRVQQVLANLLSNAVKFTPIGEVRLQVTRDGDDIHFRVCDTGIGMSEAQRARLFTPFEQGDGSTTRRFGGSGLGLAISRQLVALMGGEIGVESAPGRGSTFSLRLPLPATEPQGEPERPGAPAAPGARRLARVRVLAAEDLEVNRLVLEDLLLHEGAAVRFAENGREALDLIERLGPQSFDIALMDVQMPEMDGYAATRELRRRAPRLPVIGLTAHALAEERTRCLEAGMVDHVAKPIDPEQLVAAIRRQLAQTAPPAVAGPNATPGPASGSASGRAPGLSGIVDWSGLMHRFGGRRAFVQRLADIAIKSEADTPERLRQLAAAGDARTLAFLAHGLKGTAGNLMARSVYELALAAEQAARGASPAAFGLARDLAEATERLLTELAEWSGRIDSPS